MSPRKKTKATRGGPKRKGAKATRARSQGPTRAQQAARARIIAASGVTITEQMVEDLWREHLGT